MILFRHMDNVTIIRAVAGLAFLSVLLVGFLIPYWRIFDRLGFSGWLSILMFVPLVNFIVLYYIAFSRWNVKPDQPQLSVPPPPPEVGP